MVSLTAHKLRKYIRKHLAVTLLSVISGDKKLISRWTRTLIVRELSALASLKILKHQCRHPCASVSIYRRGQFLLKSSRPFATLWSQQAVALRCDQLHVVGMCVNPYKSIISIDKNRNSVLHA